LGRGNGSEVTWKDDKLVDGEVNRQD
jgi:hypothetical protein